MTHLTLTVLLALLTSAAAAVTGKATPRQRGHHAVWIFLSSICSVVAGSWMMFLIHG
jgi:uncharacterized membrane protein HdeD (DUF308 family)